MMWAARVSTAVVIVAALLAAASSAAASPWVLSATGARGRSVASSAPAAPSGVLATCVSSSSNTVTVSWSSVVHAATYTVYQATAASGPFTAAATVGSPTWTTGPLAGAPTTYYWRAVSTVGTKWTSGQSTTTAGRTIAANGHCS